MFWVHWSRFSNEFVNAHENLALNSCNKLDIKKIYIFNIMVSYIYNRDNDSFNYESDAIPIYA